MSEREGVIYGLVDPRNGVIRYVGQTLSYVGKRLAQHIARASEGEPCYRSCWLRKLMRLGERPFPVILERAKLPDLSEAEVRWIARLRSDVGDLLTNTTAGGERPEWKQESIERLRASQIGHTVSADTREKLRAANIGKRRGPMSDALRAKHSEASFRRYSDPAQRSKSADATRKRFESPGERARLSASKRRHYENPDARRIASEAMLKRYREHPVSAETRKKMAAVARCRTFTGETRAKMRAAMMGNKRLLGHVHGAESRAKMSLAGRKRWARQRADLWSECT